MTTEERQERLSRAANLLCAANQSEDGEAKLQTLVAALSLLRTVNTEKDVLAQRLFLDTLTALALCCDSMGAYPSAAVLMEEAHNFCTVHGFERERQEIENWQNG